MVVSRRGARDNLSNGTAGALVLSAGANALKLIITPEVLRWAAIPAVPAAVCAA